MKGLAKIAQWIYCLYALALFIALMFVVVPFVIGALFFGRISGGNFIYNVLKVWGRIWFALIGIRPMNIYEAPHNPAGQYIFVANHCSYMDIPPIVVSINQPVRVLAKYELSKIPVFGFIYKSAAILVDRSDAAHRAQSLAEMRSFLQHHVSIFIFPEGTFNESHAPLLPFFDGAFKIAIETSTSIKPILFVDTLERLHYKSLFSLTPGQCRVVYLDEVGVEGLTLADVPALKNRVYQLMEDGLRRYRSFDK